jgi:hypothetical protein
LLYADGSTDCLWLAAAISAQYASSLDKPLTLKLTGLSGCETPYIQAQAAAALGETRNPAVLYPLSLLLDAPDKETADSAAIAMQKIIASADAGHDTLAPFPEDMDGLRKLLKSWLEKNGDNCRKEFMNFAVY